MKKKTDQETRQVTIEAYERTADGLHVVARAAEEGEMFSRLFDDDGKEIYRMEV